MPATSTVGMPISAASQCMRWRVCSPMSMPAQTGTETSITFIAPKAAMPRARSSSRPSASSLARRQAGEKGATRKPSRAISAAKSLARAAGPSQARVRRRVERFARARRTSGSACSACSTSQTQAPQVRPETTSSSRCRPGFSSSAWAAKSVGGASTGRSAPAAMARLR